LNASTKFQADSMKAVATGPPVDLYIWNLNIIHPPSATLQWSTTRRIARQGGNHWHFYLHILIWDMDLI